jgi:chitodextrinase
VESTPGSREAKDAAPLCLPAVGAAGAKTPLQPFLGLNPFQTLPEISITGQPADPTNDPNPTFTFTVDAGATVQCALDASPYAACTSPQSYAGLTDGAYTFKVQATDAAGNVNVASYAFTVDTAPPALSIDAQPPALSNNVNPSFTFSATKAGTTFQCALDGAALAPCTSPQGYTALADGVHTFKVQGTDPAGNSSSASYAFTIDTVVPSVPTGLTMRAASASEIDLFWTAATDNVGVAGYKVFRDGGTTPIATVTTGTSFADTGLAAFSTHSYTVVTVDAAGNRSAPSAAAATTTLMPPATSTPTALPATSTPTTLPAATATPPTATAGPEARPRPSVTKTARPGPAHQPAKRSSSIAHKSISKPRQQAQHVFGHQRHQPHHGHVGHRAAPQSTLAEGLQQRIGALLRHLHDALRHLLPSVGV